ncbi:hypothetical protein [Bradyrhizobium liaoningense]|uniref:hypothetical protein n=1 Tax=Bradyrhizobium liaoningense TaxID=43992 RepID=UPI001BA5F206|nr:hypothetical protein [Bradyrhizobium liaoningense]MBR0941584.1 hypothetical protein [Bradyrhizobium liaoningense]
MTQRNIMYWSIFLASFAIQSQAVADNTKAVYAARDVCVGIAAKFANTPDPDSEITYDQGKFKVVRAKSGVTVFEDSVVISQMPKFDYGNYTQCLKEMAQGAK